MAGMTYNVNFHFIGITEKDLGESRKQRIINEFLALREQFVDKVNPMYDRWNAAYTDPVSGEDDEAYNNYIMEKHKPYLKLINEAAKIMGFAVRLDNFLEEPGDICGVFKIKNEKSGECILHYLQRKYAGMGTSVPILFHTIY